MFEHLTNLISLKQHYMIVTERPDSRQRQVRRSYYNQRKNQMTASYFETFKNFQILTTDKSSTVIMKGFRSLVRWEELVEVHEFSQKNTARFICI